MNGPLVVLCLVGQLTVTSYRSIPSQTDSTPYHTSIGQRTHAHGIAVSRDLLANGTFKYGDLVYVEQVGFKFVNDTMHERWVKRLDVWVESLEEERRFHRKFKGKQLRVWKVEKVWTEPLGAGKRLNGILTKPSGALQTVFSVE